MNNFFKNKTILITGAAGSIGSELSRQIYQMNPKKLLLLDNNETALFDLWDELPKAIPLLADIRNESRITEIFKKYKPQLIFHTAAYKHVKMGELFSREMYQNNVVGTQNLLNQNFEKFILISTDKAVNPYCFMGYTKEHCEELCFEKKDCLIVRFGNVLGSRGSVIPIWQKQIDEGKDLTVTDKQMKRYFMSMEEAVKLLIKAAEIGKSGDKIILDMGESVSILELAKEIIKKSKKDIGIKMIGKNPGEKFQEILMTKEERKKAIKKNRLWIISK